MPTKKKVKFLKTAVLRAQLGNVPGEVGELPGDLADELAEEGYVEIIKTKAPKPAQTKKKATAPKGGIKKVSE